MTDTKQICDAINALPDGYCQHVPMVTSQDDTGRTWECAKCQTPLGKSWEVPNFSNDLLEAIDAGCVVLFNKIVGSITTDDLKALAAENARLRGVLAECTSWRPGRGIVETHKPTHGNCCTCQFCGWPHDECVCEHNEIEEALNGKEKE